MKKFLTILVVAVALAGCQKQDQQQVSEQPTMDQRKNLAHQLVLKSFSDLQNKDLKSSIMDLEASIRVNPSEPGAYLLLAQILLKVQEYDHAAEFLTMTASKFPDNGTVSYMLAVAEKMDGKMEPAAMAARHSIEVFQAQGDHDNMLKSAALLHEIVDMANAKSDAGFKDDSKTDAAKDAAGENLPEGLPTNGND
jgi:predicted Zn-dependent protease